MNVNGPAGGPATPEDERLVEEARELRAAIGGTDLIVAIDEDDDARHLFGHTLPALCDRIEDLEDGLRSEAGAGEGERSELRRGEEGDSVLPAEAKALLLVLDKADHYGAATDEEIHAAGEELARFRVDVPLLKRALRRAGEGERKTQAALDHLASELEQVCDWQTDNVRRAYVSQLRAIAIDPNQLIGPLDAARGDGEGGGNG